jgi:uncharacterized membrane protein YraQ (UPF0718 family)
MMELTEKEKAVISTGYEKSNKRVLYFGVFLIAIAIGLVPYYLIKINKIESQWDKASLQVNTIEPVTELEKTIKSTLENSMKYSRETSYKYHYSNFLNKSGGLLLLGVFAIGIYKKSRFYLQIIRKLQGQEK